MVFSSVPLYLDPPNWQQQQVQQHHHQQQQQQICHNNSNQHEQNQHQLIPLPPSQQVLPQPHQMGMLNGSGAGSGGGGVGPGAQQIRANSMSERARLAKIPPPEVPLKCPRCDSSNTKFCYYNNYSLTQPRHFCKTCRRYWTRGGALRNVPVGGGCRRNKRTSSNNNSNNKSSSSGGGGGGAMSSKSSLSLTPQSTMVNGDHHLVSDSRGINVNSLSGSGNGMSFMASLQNIAQLGGMSNNMMGNIAQLAFSPNSNTTPLGGTGAGTGAGAGYNIGFPQQQQVQFPNFLGGFEIPGSSEGTGGLYSTLFQNIQHRHQHNNNNNDQGIENGNEVEENQPQELLNVNNMSKSCSSTSLVTPIKMEDNNNGQQQGLNLAKQLMMGISSSTNNNHNHNHNHNNNNILSRNIINNSNSNSNNNPFWGGNMTNGAAITSMWTDLSGLNSSSTTHLL